MKIVIIGGHGKVALLAAPLLVEAGHEVVSLVRNPEHADEVAATGAEPRVADVEALDVDQLATQFEGVDVVVWSAGAGGGNPARTVAVDQEAAIRSMRAAEQAGVGRYVMVSYFGARPDHGVPASNSFATYADAKAAADEALRSSSLEWVILAPSTLTLEDPTGRVEASIAEGARAQGATHVSRANVAQVLAAVVAEPAAAGRTISFNDGDQPIAALF